MKKTSGGKGYTYHDSVCIGVLKDPEDRSCRMFYANAKFRERNRLDVLPDPPAVSDSIAILYTLMFNRTEKLRETDRKNYTTGAMVDQLIAIKADKDLSSRTYKRRYKLTKKQACILSCFGIDEDYVDEQIRLVT